MEILSTGNVWNIVLLHQVDKCFLIRTQMLRCVSIFALMDTIFKICQTIGHVLLRVWQTILSTMLPIHVSALVHTVHILIRMEHVWRTVPLLFLLIPITAISAKLRAQATNLQIRQQGLVFLFVLMDILVILQMGILVNKHAQQQLNLEIQLIESVSPKKIVHLHMYSPITFRDNA